MANGRLRSVRISGFKSIRSMPPKGLDLTPVNVFIGENGAGKSNFIAFFRLLNFMMTGGLGSFVGRSGGAGALLYDGPKVTTRVEGELVYQTPAGENRYGIDLTHASGDALIFAAERIEYRKPRHDKPFGVSLGAGHAESKLSSVATNQKDKAKGKSAGVIRGLLSQCRVYQFHDTSDQSRMKQYGDIANNLYLMSDAGNIAAYLLWLKNDHSMHYQRVLQTVQMVAPFIEDFVVEPAEMNSKSTILRWRQKGSEMVFGAYHLSDGTLRFIALCTLLLQPDERLPGLLLIDEPELGLHPYAIEVLAGMLHSASSVSQVIVATQSPTLVSEFSPEEVVVVERQGNASEFRRLESGALRSWLADYSLGELWQKNALAKGAE